MNLIMAIHDSGQGNLTVDLTAAGACDDNPQ